MPEKVEYSLVKNAVMIIEDKDSTTSGITKNNNS